MNHNDSYADNWKFIEKKCCLKDLKNVKVSL